MTPIDVGEEIEAARWPPLPTGDRLVVGGRTVWLEPFEIPLLVAQPNRWGLVEDSFPEVPCRVEADPVVVGLLPHPAEVVAWVDRAHRPIPQPVASSEGRRLIAAAGRLGKMIDLIKGVRLIADPRGRTVAFTTPLEATDLISACGNELAGIRRLDGIAGGVAVAVRPDHSARDLETIAAAVRIAIESGDPA